MSGKLLITCKEATTFISKKEERKLSFYERIMLFIHMLICEFCRLFNKQNDLIINSIKEYTVEASLTEEEAGKIERAIEESSK